MTMSRFSYGAKLTPDEVDGGWVVTVRDIPEAITQGDDVESALREADDCLEEAIAARIDDQRDIPIPSPLMSDEYKVYLPIQTALKASVYLAMKESTLSKVQLASKLNRPLAKVFHGMIKSYLFLELATVVKRSLSEIAVRQHSRSETASK